MEVIGLELLSGSTTGLAVSLGLGIRILIVIAVLLCAGRKQAARWDEEQADYDRKRALVTEYIREQSRSF